ncbi:MAG: PDZ domain-containing protein, partial [Gammaproteobacteria bacterium]|nr:PDZ domain-containing protein [Gammaproteobacteria bacterium]
RLGILIEDGEGGVQVKQVVDASVAAATDIREGDVILAAGGFDTATTSELIEVIQRQAPGTWLPLKLLRGDKTIEKVAKFPQSFD